MKILRLFIVVISSILFFCSEKKKEGTSVESIGQNIDGLEDSVHQEKFDKMIEDYESKDRDEWQHPNVILNALGELKGKTVADIGAGTGYFSFKLSKRADTVFAIDIEPRFLEYIEERKEDFQSDLGKNVVTVLSQPDNPGLGEKRVDAVLLVNTYSYINNRVNYFSKVKRILKAKGKLCIVEFKQDSPIGPSDLQKVSSEIAISELRSSGFDSFQVDSTSLPYQYILLAFKGSLKK